MQIGIRQICDVRVEIQHGLQNKTSIKLHFVRLLFLERLGTNPSRAGSWAVNSVNSVSRIQLGISSKTWGNPGNIHRSGCVDRVVKDFIFVFVSVTVKLGGYRRFESVDDLGEFSAKDGPAIGVTRRNVAKNMNLNVKFHLYF